MTAFSLLFLNLISLLDKIMTNYFVPTKCTDAGKSAPKNLPDTARVNSIVLPVTLASVKESNFNVTKSMPKMVKVPALSPLKAVISPVSSSTSTSNSIVIFPGILPICGKSQLKIPFQEYKMQHVAHNLLLSFDLIHCTVISTFVIADCQYGTYTIYIHHCGSVSRLCHSETCCNKGSS